MKICIQTKKAKVQSKLLMDDMDSLIGWNLLIQLSRCQSFMLE